MGGARRGAAVGMAQEDLVHAGSRARYTGPQETAALTISSLHVKARLPLSKGLLRKIMQCPHRCLMATIATIGQWCGSDGIALTNVSSAFCKLCDMRMPGDF